MARKTRKYRAARRAYLDYFPNERVPRDNNVLYSILESSGFWWQAKTGQWTQSEKPSTSIFENGNGTATGIAKIRVMCHPQDTYYFLKALHEMNAFRVIEASEDTYPNRNGAGERTYITVLRKEVDL